MNFDWDGQSQTVERREPQIRFYAFDVLAYRGRSVMRLPLETRRDLLAEALAKVEYPGASLYAL
jgi:ATP-dependent DNA ligase